MDIKTLESFRLSDAVKFHNALNPKIWHGNHLRPEVKKQLKIIAEDFLEELGVSGLDVKDLTISGSNAAYSYTPHSDLDLHILIDMKDLSDDEVYKELFNAKKTIYNDSHDIKVHDVPVELYVQDINEPAVSLGEYSILQDKWLRLPTKRRANFDNTATKVKYEKLLTLVQHALKFKNLEKINDIIKKIRQYRQAGLDKFGEFGPENLAYKALRSQGYITKLYALRDKLHSESLTIETMYKNPVKLQKDNLKEKLSKEFEDYDPNGPPPGPEFKPTMPKGTVRVDVSDVYDWYKLGQYISNLDKADPKIFGKGPPSTIMAFGSEEEEHKYIDALKKLGLTTTDIDPVDPNQPKGMKRQKVDPTYNVNEDQDELPKKIYHVTPSENLDSILSKGLIPQKGNRSSKMVDEKSAIYCFPDKTSMEDAVMNWLGDEFEEDEPLALLEIDTEGLDGNVTDGADFEIAITTPIPPDRIRVLSRDLAIPISESSGYIPSEKEKNDPRFKTALTVDVKPDAIKKNAKAFGFNVKRSGVPPLLRS